MCGRFYVPEDGSIQMIRAIVERLELDRRNVGEAGGCDKETRMEVNRHQRRQDFRATS